MKIEEARERVGATVVYTPRNLDGHALIHKRERGVITSVGERLVFVRYDTQHPTACGQATEPGRLDFLP